MPVVEVASARERLDFRGVPDAFDFDLRVGRFEVDFWDAAILGVFRLGVDALFADDFAAFLPLWIVKWVPLSP